MPCHHLFRCVCLFVSIQFLLLLLLFVPVSYSAVCEQPHVVAYTPTVDFGMVNVGSSKTMTIVLQYYRSEYRNPQYKVLGGLCVCPDPAAPDYVNVKILGVGYVYQAAQTNFTIYNYGCDLNPPAIPAGAYSRDVPVNVTFTPVVEGDIHQYADITITNSSYVLGSTVHLIGSGHKPTPNINLSPISLNFGSVNAGGSLSQNILISNAGDAALTVSSVSATGPFSISDTSFNLNPGAAKNLAVSFKPPTTGEMTGQIVINSNDPDAGELRVNTIGTGIGSNLKFASGLDLEMVDFGAVIINSSKSLPVKIQNNGNVDLNISNVVSDNGVFKPNVAGLTIPPGSEGVLDVVYAPSSIGENSGNLSFQTNDVNHSSVKVFLEGFSLADLDLSVQKFQMFQGLSTDVWGIGGVPKYVTNKKTAVRVYISAKRSSGQELTVTGVDGIIKINGMTYQSDNGPIKVTPSSVEEKEMDISKTLNFTITQNVAGGYKFETFINPSSGARVSRIEENNYDNNYGIKYLNFYDRYVPMIAYIPISYLSYGLPWEHRVVAGAEIMRSLYPVGDIRYVQFPPISFNEQLNSELKTSKLAAILFKARYFGTTEMPDKIFGWLPELQIDKRNFLGYSYTPSRTAVAYADAVYYKDTFAHELGHAYGLCHTHSTECSGLYWQSGVVVEERACPNDPQKTCLYNVYHDGHVCRDPSDVNMSGAELDASDCKDVAPGYTGLDPYTWELKPSMSADDYFGCRDQGGYVDFMAYKAPYDETKKEYLCTVQAEGRWIHPNRYEFLFERLESKYSDWAYLFGCELNSPVKGACLSVDMDIPRQAALIISGFVRGDSAFLAPVYTFETIPDISEDRLISDEPAEYSLRIISSEDKVVAIIPLPIKAEQPTNDDLLRSSFAIAIPEIEDIQKIQIVNNDNVLIERIKSGAVPSVAIQNVSLTDSIFGAQWTAEDTDGDDLTYSVLYSRDSGKTFIPLAIDIQAKSFQYNSDFLGGGDTSVIRVLATDGLNTAFADSAIFTLPKKAPAIHVTAPRSGKTFFNGAALFLEAVVSDPEDLDIKGESIKWTSSIDGVLGSGNSLVVPTLSLGTHVISASVIDSDGMSVTEELIVHIVDGALAPRVILAASSEVIEGETAYLDGSGSSDPQDLPLAYTWEYASGPLVTLDNSFDAISTFKAPSVDGDQEVEFKLVVTNSETVSNTAFQKVIVRDVYYPVMELDRESIDFEKTRVGSTSKEAFIIRNSGTEPLTILDVVSNSEAFIPQQKTLTIMPGGSQEVDIVFTPTGDATYYGMIEVVAKYARGVGTLNVVGQTEASGIAVDKGKDGDMLDKWPEETENPALPNSGGDSDFGYANSFSGGGGCSLSVANCMCGPVFVLLILFMTPVVSAIRRKKCLR